MTSTADRLPDSAPLGRDVLARVRVVRCGRDDLDRELMVLAVEYAYANPALPGQQAWEPTALPLWITPLSEEEIAALGPEDCEWHGIPSLRWDAPAAFAAANGMSTTAGKAFIRDALVLKHRVPGVWAALMGGHTTAWQARKVAQALLGEHHDVCAYVDSELTDRLATQGSIGTIVVERLVDEAMLRLHAEERELDQIEALDRRHVTIDASTINHTGIADLEARADWIDLSAFDQTVSQVAEAIQDLPEYQHESLDVRRSIALGILADPARAQAILDGHTTAKPTRRRELVADLHLTEANVFTHDPVITDADHRAHLQQVILAWVGRHDIALTVRGVRHCGGRDGGCVGCPAEIDCDHHTRHALEDYVPNKLDRAVVEAANPTCVHPHCRRRARRCDCDHVKAWDSGGVTCPKCNLAPLCRHHHRLKTHAGWRYWKLAPDTYLWIDPHGLMYLRTGEVTRELD